MSTSARTIKTFRWKRAALWCAGLVAAIGVLGFLAAPPIVRSVAAEQIGKALHRPVSIAGIAINPYALSLTVRGLEVKEPDGQAVALRVDEAYVNLEAQSLFRGGAVLREIRVDKPYLRVERRADKSYNWTDLIREFLAKPASEPTRFVLANVQINGGRIDFDDRPMNMQHVVDELKFGVPLVSNLEADVDTFVEPELSLRVDGTPLAVKARSKAFKDSRDSQADIRFAGLPLARFADYSPVPLPVKLVAGALGADLRITFAQPGSGAPALAISGQAEVKGLDLRGPGDEPLLKLGELVVAMKELAPLAGRFDIERVSVQAPELSLRRGRDGVLNLQRLAAAKPAAVEAAPVAAAGTPAKEGAGPALRYRLGELRLGEGRIGFVDEAVAPHFETALEAITLVLTGLGSEPGDRAGVEISLRTAAGETLQHSGKLTLAPLAAQGHVSLSGLQPARVQPYLASALRMVVAGGSADFAADYSFAGEGGQFALSNLLLGVRDLKLREEGGKNEFLTLGELGIEQGGVDIAAQRVAIGELRITALKLDVLRDRAGSLNLAKLVREAPSEPAPAPAKPWSTEVKRLQVAGSTLRFEDRAPEPAVKLAADKLRLEVSDFTWPQKSPAKVVLEAGIGRRGSLSVNGSVLAEPLKANFRLDARGLELLPFQPYFADKLNITLTRGEVLARGNVGLERTKTGTIAASFRGDAGVVNLNTVDKTNAADFLNWKSLHFAGVDFRSAPLALDVKDISLTDFYSRLIINPDGQFNLQQVVRGEAPPAVDQPATTPARPDGQGVPAAPPTYKVHIAAVTLQGGNVNFSDFFIKPNYSANLTQIGGRVAGLSSDPGTTAEVDLKGNVDNTAPLTIAGRINPLAGNLLLDIKADARDIELSALTPYSGKYVGYGIEKGKLSVSLGYKVENRKLEAQNQVYLDQLTFGEKIDSPDATKLPVLLAVSLLKDRNGVIDINLPVSGSLDDPQFSVFGIVMRVFVNLVVKAVTAPFALLGSMFGGGEDLGFVDFDAGRAAVAEASRKKLDGLAKALADRPGLKLEISGRADPAADREGLKRVALERKVRAQKVKDLARGGEEAAAGEVSVSAEEYPKYLARAYKDEKFPKPRNLIGLAKDLPVPEMEKLMLTHGEVSDEDLRQLANRRAQGLKDYLTGQGKVAAERVFIVAAKLAGEPGKGTRAEFSLK